MIGQFARRGHCYVKGKRSGNRASPSATGSFGSCYSEFLPYALRKSLAKYDNPAFFNYAYNPSNILTQQHNSNCLQDKDLSSVSIQLDFCRSACGYRTIYDANGNCVTANGDTYTTGDNNQTTSDGIYSYLYDSEGNLVAKYIDEDTSGTLDTGDTDVTAYTWDYHNRLTNVSHYDEAGGAADMSVDYVYDAYNRRISRTLDADGAGVGGSSTEHYVWDGTKVMLDLLDSDGSGETYSPTPEIRYLWGQAVDQLFAQETIDDGGAEDVLYPVIDNLHSVRSLVDYLGQITATYSYDTYGNVTVLVNQQKNYLTVTPNRIPILISEKSISCSATPSCGTSWIVIQVVILIRTGSKPSRSGSAPALLRPPLWRL